MRREVASMENNKINLLIVDDEVQFLESISKSLEVREFKVIAVDRGEKAIEAARKNPIDVALVDLKMPGINGEETLKALKAEHKWMEVVILTGHGTIDSAVECTKSGAYSYLQKPCSLDELLESLINAPLRLPPAGWLSAWLHPCRPANWASPWHPWV